MDAGGTAECLTFCWGNCNIAASKHQHAIRKSHPLTLIFIHSARFVMMMEELYHQHTHPRLGTLSGDGIALGRSRRTAAT